MNARRCHMWTSGALVYKEGGSRKSVPMWVAWFPDSSLAKGCGPISSSCIAAKLDSNSSFVHIRDGGTYLIAFAAPVSTPVLLLVSMPPRHETGCKKSRATFRERLETWRSLQNPAEQLDRLQIESHHCFLKGKCLRCGHILCARS